MFHMPISHVFNDGRNVVVTRRHEPTYSLIHTHDFYEITYVISGTGVHIINDESIPVQKGDLFFINLGTAHSYKGFDNDQNLEVYNCIFRKDFYKRLSPPLKSNSKGESVRDFLPGSMVARPYIKLSDMQSVESNLNALHREGIVNRDSEFYENVYNSLLEEILSLVSENYKKQYPPADSIEILETVAEYIKNHYRETITTQELCKIARLSPSYFCRLFKKHFGTTVSQYIINCRLNAARSMLENTSMQVSAIAGAVGYSSESFFRNSFRKNFAMTPTQYRKSFIKSLK